MSAIRQSESTKSGSPAPLSVRRQLFFPVSDNYFSLSTTITDLAKFHRSPKLVLAAAEDRAMQGCNPSADCGACTVNAGAGPKVRRPGGEEI